MFEEFNNQENLKNLFFFSELLILCEILLCYKNGYLSHIIVYTVKSIM
jgi:hypothetical protein